MPARRGVSGEVRVADPMTNDIKVSVEPVFLDDQSEPAEDYYVWAYRVQITNQGKKVVQLRARYWHITDGNNQVQEVHGVGVVGEQPVLKPGESFEYTSGTPLNTPSGIMTGNYRMESEDGEVFDVAIPVFLLDSPYDRRRIH